MSGHPAPRLEPVPGHLTDRLNHQLVGELYEGKPVAVLMSDGRWLVGAVTEEWQTRDRRWCVMLRYPIQSEHTTSTGAFFHDPAAVKELPEGWEPGPAAGDPYPPEG
ncbi:MAG: hypothetical protein JWL97_3911 [Gemmatimonadales bacterium]|nr:hypothetical protein [Gemmatimonadales bacterium]